MNTRAESPYARRHAVRRSSSIVLAALVAACTGRDATSPAAVDGQHLLYALSLDHHAITLATAEPWSSLQLTPRATSTSGNELATGPVLYSVSDSQRVMVDASGLVTALAPGSAIQLIASVTEGNVTRKDTAYINVVETTDPPALETFTLALASGNTSIPAMDFLGIFGVDMAMPTAADGAGMPIDGLPIYFTSSDPTTVKVESVTGSVNAIRPGTAWIRAATTAYGVTKIDSLQITVGNPLFGAVNIVARNPVGSTPQLAFEPGTLTVGVGATVVFLTYTAAMGTDVVFDDPTDVAESPLIPTGAGNIEEFRGEGEFHDNFRSRAFPKPGTYTYHSTLYNTNGRIIVQ